MADKKRFGSFRTIGVNVSPKTINTKFANTLVEGVYSCDKINPEESLAEEWS